MQIGRGQREVLGLLEPFCLHAKRGAQLVGGRRIKTILGRSKQNVVDRTQEIRQVADRRLRERARNNVGRASEVRGMQAMDFEVAHLACNSRSQTRADEHGFQPQHMYISGNIRRFGKKSPQAFRQHDVIFQNETSLTTGFQEGHPCRTMAHRAGPLRTAHSSSHGTKITIETVESLDTLEWQSQRLELSRHKPQPIRAALKVDQKNQHLCNSIDLKFEVTIAPAR